MRTAPTFESPEDCRRYFEERFEERFGKPEEFLKYLEKTLKEFKKENQALFVIYANPDFIPRFSIENRQKLYDCLSYLKREVMALSKVLDELIANQFEAIEV